ncbi:hypothetical protein [Lysobacter xanthus]
MTLHLLHTLLAGPDTPEPDPVGRMDREVIGQVDLDRASALIERRSSSALLDELAGIVQALEVADLRTAHRRPGIVARLLARDLSAQARARQARDHIRIRLQLAERRAQDVAAHICELDEAIAHVARQSARLVEIAERGRGAFESLAMRGESGPDPMERRLAHLGMLIRSWDVAVAHMRLVRQYGELLLARYAYVRDVVVPGWQRAVEAPGGPDGAAPDGSLREALASLLHATSPEPAVFPRGADVRV